MDSYFNSGNKRISEELKWVFIFLWILFSVGYTYFLGENLRYDFPTTLGIVFIASGLPLFCVFYVIVNFYRKLRNELYYFPKERRKIAEILDLKESKCINIINQAIDNASKGLESNRNPLWKKIQQNLIDNHYRSILEDYYLTVRKTLSERDDFDLSYVQAIYKVIDEKLACLSEELPYSDLDIENEFSPSVIDAYEKFSTAWFTLANNSEYIMRYGSPIPFPRFSFGRVRVGDVPIPSFMGSDDDIIYFFPSFIIVFKADFSIVFYPIDKISIDITEDITEFQAPKVPGDAVYVDEFWEHSNKDGSRDARYNDNKLYVRYKVAQILILGCKELFSFEASNYGLSSIMGAKFIALKIAVLDKPHKTDTEKYEIELLKEQLPDQKRDEINLSKLTNRNIRDKKAMLPIYPIYDLDAADPLFVDAVYWILSTQSATASTIQRHFGIGYQRSQKILDEIEAAGIISSATTTSRTKEIEFTISKFEEWLDFQMSVKKETSSKDASVVTSKIETANHSNATKELNALIGLDGVKEEIVKLQNFIKIQLARKSKGLKTSPISYHCVFTGNPGTGKTTVARIVAEIYRDMGILKKGHLVETDRSGLVAEWIGQTAPKTNQVIDSALDGILFIDEAYSLVQSYSNDFGYEAISTLLKRMEDDRDRLVVIIAGYSNEMKTFIDANPGLQSRFNRYIHFEDYSAEELLEIFEFNLKKNQYKISDSARVLLKSYLDDAVANKDKNFGNGRFVRNVFEKTLQNQATRLSAIENLTKEALQLIVDEDILSIGLSDNSINRTEITVKEQHEQKQTGQDAPQLSRLKVDRNSVRQKFWRYFIDYNVQHHGPFANSSTSGKDSWISRGLGTSCIDMSVYITNQSCRSQIGLNFGGDKRKNKTVFDMLFKKKDEIQISMSSAYPLVWERLDNQIACRIYTELQKSYLDDSDIPEIMEFLLKSSNKMMDVFSNYIPDIKQM